MRYYVLDYQGWCYGDFATREIAEDYIKILLNVDASYGHYRTDTYHIEER